MNPFGKIKRFDLLPRILPEYSFDYPAMHIGQPIVTALKTVSEAFVVDAQEVQNRRLQIVNVHAVFGHAVTEIVA